MKLFKNNNTIVGLFDNGKVMEEAITKLQEQGFGKDDETLHVIDKQHLEQQAPAMTPSATIPSGQTHSGTMPVDVGDMINSENNEPARVERTTFDMLTDFGLDKAEATFYARQVARGNSLVVIQTDEKGASKVTSIMEQFDARTVKA